MKIRNSFSFPVRFFTFWAVTATLLSLLSCSVASPVPSDRLAPRLMRGVGLLELLPPGTPTYWEGIGGGCPESLRPCRGTWKPPARGFTRGDLPCSLGSSKIPGKEALAATDRPRDAQWVGETGETWATGTCRALELAFRAGALGSRDRFDGVPTVAEGLALIATTHRRCHLAPRGVGCLYRYLPPTQSPPPPPPPALDVIRVLCDQRGIVVESPREPARAFRPSVMSTGRTRLQLVGAGQVVCPRSDR